MKHTDIKKIVKQIDHDELMQLLSFDPNVKLIDVLDSSHYAKEHIKSAISLPLQEIRQRAQEFLKKDETIVTYCADFKCSASTNAAEILLALGYENVLDYKGGLADYKQANLPLEGFLYATK